MKIPLCTQFQYQYSQFVSLFIFLISLKDSIGYSYTKILMKDN